MNDNDSTGCGVVLIVIIILMICGVPIFALAGALFPALIAIYIAYMIMR